MSSLRAASCRLPTAVVPEFGLIGLSARVCAVGPLIGSVPGCLPGLNRLLLVDASVLVVSGTFL